MQSPKQQVQQRLSKAILAKPSTSENKQTTQKIKQTISTTKTKKRQDSDVGNDEPNVSDTSLLVTVKDLINLAFGPHNINKVNFKMIKTIIKMLANQLRLLDKKVQINTDIVMNRKAATAAAKVDSANKSPGKKRLQKQEEDCGRKTETGEFSDVYDDDEEEYFKPGADKLEPNKSVEDIKNDIRMEKKNKTAAFKKSRITNKKEIRDKTPEEAESLYKTESTLREISGIEVVPMSRFKHLEEILEDLNKKNTVPPILDKKLRDDLNKGMTSLPDTMNALSLAARVQSAENAIDCLSIMITKLTSETTLQGELENIENPSLHKKSDMKIVTEMRKYEEEGKEKELTIYVKQQEVPKETGLTGLKSLTSTHGRVQGIKSGMMRSSHSIARMSDVKCNKVTYEEMNEKIRVLGEGFHKKLNEITGFATSAAEHALVMVTALSHKLEVALGLDSRITLITNIVHDYVQEMRGIDYSKDIQMANFQEQLNQILNELRAGLELLIKYDKNAKNTAIIELKEFYKLLVQELDESLERHQKAVFVQEQLGLEIRSLVESIEGLRAQKADRDEIADGLKDKADISCLRGLLKEKIFIAEQMNLESRLLICNEKFRKQEETWLCVIKDFEELTKLKADLQHVLEAKETMQGGLQDVYKKLQLLARVLGDPKAAVVTRKMQMSASCAACKTPARLDTSPHTEDLEMKLPSLGKQNRQDLMRDDRDREAMWELLDVPRDRKHACHRWSGGSHTILPASIAVQRAPRRFPSAPPTKAYFSLGEDGKRYRCSRRVDACQCNDPVESPQVK